MSAAGQDVTAVTVATCDTVARARATARSAQQAGGVAVLVVDVDGTYEPVASEQVVSLAGAVQRLGVTREAVTAAATLDPGQLAFYAGTVGAACALDLGAPGVLVLGAGVLVLDALGPVLGLLEETGAVVVPAADADSVRGRAAAEPVGQRRDRATGLLSLQEPPTPPLHARSLYGVRSAAAAARLRELAADWRVAADALETFAVDVGATVAGAQHLLLGPWRGVGAVIADEDGALAVDGQRVTALDLSTLDPGRPWVLDPDALSTPRLLLSEHPELARVVAAEAGERLTDEAALSASGGVPDRTRVDPVLRTEARRAHLADDELPDLLGLLDGPQLDSWATTPIPVGDQRPVARYLAAVRAARPDLQAAFEAVPGRGSAALARWALRAGVQESGHDPGLLARAAEATLAAQAGGQGKGQGPLPAGVNLVGYLAGELGLGESARLVDLALQSAGVDTSTYDVSRDLKSRRGAAYRRAEQVMHDTSLLCVNGAETAAMAPQLDVLLKRTRTIGMWYWELEDFPAEHLVGFQHVDEVWAATDFMRDAIAVHAGDTPVRTVMPPLPQAGDDPGVVPERFGIPQDRPWFLFTFDFLSLAPRKNPYGLVEAFTRAFADRPEGQRPVLVIKTINAERHPVDAERLRLQIAGRSDVLFLDTYLDNHERHVLVSHCTAYVSLHKAEGLGLTVAEAMAWGKPVITTAYGGVMQFCTEENSLLVDWRRGYVEETVGPYRKGLPWAEPDLDQAAALMRLVVDDPDRAAAIGGRAAVDIRERHNAEVAGAEMRRVLEVGRSEWEAAKAERRAARQPEPPPEESRSRWPSWRRVRDRD